MLIHLQCLFMKFTILAIRLYVEIGEHVEEYRTLNEADPKPSGRVSGLKVAQRKRIADKYDELSDLYLGDVSLPPEVGLNAWTKCRQCIVAVHNCVDE